MVRLPGGDSDHSVLEELSARSDDIAWYFANSPDAINLVKVLNDIERWVRRLPLTKESLYLRANLFALFRECALLHEIGDLIPIISANELALETGPGYSSLFLRLHWKMRLCVIDIDTSYSNIMHCNHIQYVQCDFAARRLPFADNSIDYVHFTDTVSSIQYGILHFLGEFNRILKPGAPLLLTAPNFCSLQNRMKVLAGFNCQDPVLPTPRVRRNHVRREYTIDEVQLLLSAAGFTIETTRFLLFNRDCARKDFHSQKVGFISRWFSHQFLNYIPSLRNSFVILARASTESPRC